MIDETPYNSGSHYNIEHGNCENEAAMTEQSPQSLNLLYLFNRYLLLKQSIGFISGLGLLGSGIVWTQMATATGSLEITDTPADIAPPVPVAAPPVAPAPVTVPKAAPIQIPVSKPAVQTPSVSTTTQPSKVELSAPKISVPPTAPSRAINITPQTQTTEIQLSPKVAEPGKNSYIDTTNYSRGATEPYTSPSAVVLTERSTGCQTVSQNGQLTRGSCGVAIKRQTSLTARNSLSQPTLLRRNRLSPPTLIASSRTVPLRVYQSTRWQGGSIKINQGQGNAVSLALAPIPQYNRATANLSQIPLEERKTSLIFPLSIPAAITSAFGWRMHPITGTGRMHSGTDVGAAIGTPVLAAYPGEVAVADWSGGYGLMVVLRHEEGTQESRYAHLSEIFVKPGEWVEQGTVIGRVGSTGMSTGPHLHFEWRYLTNDGWVAVDAGLHLEYALDNLIRSIQIAQAEPNQGG